MYDILNIGADFMNMVKNIIHTGSESRMSDEEFLQREIMKFKRSAKRKAMLDGEKYYDGEHDILKRQRTIIGEKGQLQEVHNLPNNKIVDNQYAKMVDQKVNYLLAKPPTFETKNKSYADLLKEIFNNRFLRTFRNLGEDSLNEGLGWLHPYYNTRGELCFKRFPAYEILPFWRDSEHTDLEFAVRIYFVESYEGAKEVIVEKVEVYDTQGIHRFILQQNSLIPDIENPSSNYLATIDETGKETTWNWTKVPLIAFKYNNKEIPLIRRVKSLQDGINIVLSDFQNNMQEDARNTILVLQNYDGTDLGEFRRNLAQYGAVKVRTVDGKGGDLKTLEVQVNNENYKVILELFKKALIENARGYDAKDDRMSGNPNQMNIQSMYSDIDLDANGMESEFQAAFEELLWFVNVHLANTGKGDFEGETVKVIFNRDILINENESISNCKNSVGILADETIVSQHPWVHDVDEELKRLDEQKKKDASELDPYAGTFSQTIQESAKGGVNNAT